MAALATSAVSFYPTDLASSDFIFGPRAGLVVRRLKLVLTGQGGQTNTIPYSALQMEQILYASNLWDATNSKGYPVVLDPVNKLLILVDGSAAPAPVDVTSTATYITVIGLPKVTPG